MPLKKVVLDAARQYEVKNQLQSIIDLAARLESDASYLRTRALELNTEIGLPDFSEFEEAPAPAPEPPPAPYISTRFGSPPAEVAAAIMSAWPEALWTSAAEVAYLESGWNPRAVLDTTRPDAPCGTVIEVRNGVRITAERSVGLYQYNECAHGQLVNWDDPTLNAVKGYELYKAAGNSFAPWYFSGKRLGLL